MGGGPDIDSSFTGSYNGKGHTIDSLFINRGTQSYVGLFGIIKSAAIDSLGLKNVNFTGADGTGGLVGEAGVGSIINGCYTSGTITSNGNMAGGLIGSNYGSINYSFSESFASGEIYVGGLIGLSLLEGTVTNCYCTGNVISILNQDSGGLVGFNFGNISNSYSTGSVKNASGSTSGFRTGGLVGQQIGTTINCFWDTETSEMLTSPGFGPSSEVGKLTLEMKDITTFTSTSWDFINESINGNNDYWLIPCGLDNYPKLSWQNINGNGVSDLTTTLNGATITANNANASYAWLDCDNGNTLINSETGQLFTATVNGNYAVELTESGCVDTTSCVAITTVGILENNFGNEFKLYPNPTDGKFSVDLGENHNYFKINITDINGRLIQSSEYNNVQILNLNIAEPKGIYLLTVESAEQRAVIRLVKQ